MTDRTGPLSPEDRRRLESLFARAADLPPTEHAAFVDRECGQDGDLRRELSRLLAGLVGEDVVSRLGRGQRLRPGTRIGAYRLVEQIGEGGMGEVYSAEQLEPVARRVAVKITRLGMDTAQVVARFEAERQALARMAHPNIAQVYDAGTTDDGRPYFVMELVDGVPITEYCDRHRLSTRQRLDLFLGICGGVQHAHQKGVIHRDLKPSNLLVMEQDHRAMAKIIDFGVARATTGRLAALTLHTMAGQIVGTIDYMSPEQADPGNADIDTRSDVYSLGVVLYQLLCGLLPFDQSSTCQLPLSEILRAIREKDPPSPSTRLRRHLDTEMTPASGRDSDGPALIRRLAGDLDWICLKALEKDPARRYASASRLAEDLRRHIAHEPVVAGPPGRLYRLRKYVRRNRLAVTAGVLTGAGVIAGVLGIASGRMVARALQPQADEYAAKALLERADGLWPPHPAMIPALERWLGEARQLVESREAHRAQRDRRRERARPRTAVEIARDREMEPFASELAQNQDSLSWQLRRIEAGLTGEEREVAGRQVERLASLISALQAKAGTRRTWSFESPVEQSSHEVLSNLVEELETLGDDDGGLLAADGMVPGRGWSVPKRLAFARDLKEGFAEGGAHAAAWAALAGDPDFERTYPGLDLQPQMGLLPTGRDPDSGLWEFAHLLTGDLPQRDADDRIIRTEGMCVVLVLIPCGWFWMGAQSEDPSKPNHDERVKRDSRPVHRVQLSAYFISKYEMTQGQWKRLTGRNPSRYGRDGMWEFEWLQPHSQASLLHPVEQVSFRACEAWLGRAGLSLPSEAQWERAARGNTRTRYSTGQEPETLQGHANVSDRYGIRHGGAAHQQPVNIDDGSTMHAPVGSYRPNGFGLFDVHGNVYEWCVDGYDDHANFYRDGPAVNPVAPGFGASPRVYRGGSYRAGAGAAASWARSYNPPLMEGHALGVRPAARVISR